MVQIVAAHIENGVVIPDQPLPANGKVEKVSILLELADAGTTATQPVQPPHPEAVGLLRWAGILKDYHGNYKEDVRKIIAEKYL